MASSPPDAWPGRPTALLPLLLYPPTVYFGRLVALAIEAAPTRLHGTTHAECEMADVLRGLAIAGQGVAWLPDCALRPGDEALLEPLGNGAWSETVAIIAVRDRAEPRPALQRLWSTLATPPATQGEPPCDSPTLP